MYDLEYADDLALISDSMDILKEVLQAMEVSCFEMGLTISSKKTKIYLLFTQLAGLPNLQGQGRRKRILNGGLKSN